MTSHVPVVGEPGNECFGRDLAPVMVWKFVFQQMSTRDLVQCALACRDWYLLLTQRDEGAHGRECFNSDVPPRWIIALRNGPLRLREHADLAWSETLGTMSRTEALADLLITDRQFRSLQKYRPLRLATYWSTSMRTHVATLDAVRCSIDRWKEPGAMIDERRRRRAVAQHKRLSRDRARKRITDVFDRHMAAACTPRWYQSLEQWARGQRLPCQPVEVTDGARRIHCRALSSLDSVWPGVNYHRLWIQQWREAYQYIGGLRMPSRVPKIVYRHMRVIVERRCAGAMLRAADDLDPGHVATMKRNGIPDAAWMDRWLGEYDRWLEPPGPTSFVSSQEKDLPGNIDHLYVDGDSDEDDECQSEDWYTSDDGNDEDVEDDEDVENDEDDES